MVPRRVTAPLIRARQEFSKRWDRLRPLASPIAIVGSAPHLPLSCAGRQGLPPLARQAILAEAAAVSTGRWTVFGADAEAFRRGGDWRAHPISGTNTPLMHWSLVPHMDGQAGGDVKEIWELNRHRGLLRLAQAYFLERDSRWLGPLAKGLDQWMLQNPPGMGINWVSSLEVALRALSWTWIRALTADSPIWQPERDEAFARALWQHGRHVFRYDSIHHSPNTHLTGEALALAVLGRAWPSWPDADRWVRRGDATLHEELRRQVQSDGMHFERASGYHRYTAEFYLLWIALRRSFGEAISTSVEESLSSLLEAMVTLRRPDGRLPALGDEDGGTALPLGIAHPRSPDPLLALGSGLLERPEWRWGISSTAHDLAWWVLGDDAWEALAVSPPPASRWGTRSLGVSGYHVLRNPDPAGWWCLVDAGTQAGEYAGHSHADLGHVELALGTAICVSDPGSLAYGPDQASRNFDRSTEAHATLAVHRAPLAEPGGPFRWHRLAPTPTVRLVTQPEWSACVLAYEWADDGGRPLRHERQVALIGDSGVVVTDWLTGAAGHQVTVTWPFPMSPSTIIREAEGVVLPACGARLRWLVQAVTAPDVKLEGRLVADTYRTPVPGTFLRISGTAGERAVLVSWFTRTDDVMVVDLTAEGVVRVTRPGVPLIELVGGRA